MIVKVLGKVALVRMYFCPYAPRILLALCLTGFAAIAASDVLEEDQFRNPEDEYKPRTWMHALNGNLSKEGFTKDFEAMKEAGIGGALFFHIDRRIPEGPVAFGSDEYFDVLGHATREAERIGIEFGLHNCGGWSSSGGPWITPEMSMKKVVWSETIVEGGTGKVVLGKPGASHGFYGDIAVVAIPASDEEARLLSNEARIDFSKAIGDSDFLFDADIENSVEILADDETGEVWLEFGYEQPVTIRSLHIEHGSRNAEASLWVAGENGAFSKVVALDKYRIGKQWWTFTDTFEAVRGKRFRVAFDQDVSVRLLDVSSDARIDKWIVQNGMGIGESKRSMVSLQNVDASAGLPSGVGTSLANVQVLNRGALEDGPLVYALPRGQWKVYRFGYTSTGAKNHPATDAGRGLECDKFDGSALAFHFDQYVGRVNREAKKLGHRGLSYAEIDSYEMGGQNWTAGLEAIFSERYGYDIARFLPCFTGRVIESPEASQGVLTDFRKLASDLMVKNYFKRFTEVCNENGLKSYIEPYGIGPFGELEAGGVADMVMGEFWVADEGFKGYYNVTAASAAHIYGKEIVSAEAYTAWSTVNWKGHPYSMKIYGDHAWTDGVNQTMFHRFAHQANTKVTPGMTMGEVGSHIDRTQTWWRNAGKAWFAYLARGSYLLRQGNPVSDILILTGDEAPNRAPRRGLIDPPLGYKADYCNIDVLMNRIRVEGGELVLPEGTRYKLLQLFNCEMLRFATVERLEELARAGAVIVGPAPVRPIGYKELTEGRAKFEAKVRSLWGDGSKPRRIGKGWIFPSGKAEDAFAQLGIGPDLKLDGEGALSFTHRKIGEEHVYFFFNAEAEAKTISCDFRVAGLVPELWKADTGNVFALGDFVRDSGRTSLRLELDPKGSAFVVFREAEKSGHPMSSSLIERSRIEVGGNWDVSFDPAWGGPGTITIDELGDWSESAVEGVRFYSGTADYAKTLNIEEAWLTAGKQVRLDLGRVEIAAEVFVNESRVATLWKPPFELDITSYLRPGENRIQVKVTNQWTNRLIGDEAYERTDVYEKSGKMVDWYSRGESPPTSKRVTFTTYNFYAQEKDRILLPAGLIGPVEIVLLDPVLD